MRQFYKPNPKCSGSACNFSVTSSGKGQGIYVEMIKQKSWDEAQKTGKFDKEYKINLKFGEHEIAEMMVINQRQKGSVKFFHTSDAGAAQISYGVYNDKDGNPKGIALGVSKGDKKLSIPFTFGEAVLLNEWFRFALSRIFTADFAEAKKKREKLAETNISE